MRKREYGARERVSVRGSRVVSGMAQNMRLSPVPGIRDSMRDIAVEKDVDLQPVVRLAGEWGL